MKGRRTIHHPLAVLLLGALLVCSKSAMAQSSNEQEDAVEATEEELDAVGGLRGPEKAPTLESVESGAGSSDREVSSSNIDPTTPLVDERPSDSEDSLSESEDAYQFSTSLRIGFGFSTIATPAFNSDFSVRDDSPSRSIYDFSADVGATNEQTHFAVGVNFMWDVLGPLQAGFNIDFGYAPLDWEAGITAIHIGPTMQYPITESFLIGTGIGLGFMTYQLDFDVLATSDSDSFMTFDDTDINFDSSGMADMTVRKDGLLLAPELNLTYRSDGALKYGIVLRIQYLQHSVDTDAPWNLEFKERDGANTDETGESSPSSVTIDYTDDYVVTGSELPKVFDFSGLAYSIQFQLTF